MAHNVRSIRPLGCALALISACGGEEPGSRRVEDAGSMSVAVGDAGAARSDASDPRWSAATFDVDHQVLPRFIVHDYIELAKIARIGRFRSAIGHDYVDSVERCRSMKHYFQPSSSIDWATVGIVAPFDGTVVRLDPEWAGTQLHLRASEQAAFTVVIFHLRPDPSLVVGSAVRAGQDLGTHVSSQTMSDVAVQVNTPGGFRLVSYFDLITDEVMAGYHARGVEGRGAFVITQAERDADPLACDGEAFTTMGMLESWVALR